MRRSWGIAAVLWLGAVGSVAGAPADRGPAWIQQPTEEELEPFYPEAAREAGVEASTRLECLVGVDGAVNACTVLEEAPAGWGFDRAVGKAAKVFKMRPAIKGGRAVESRIRLTLRWSLDEPTAAAQIPVLARPDSQALVRSYPPLAAALRLGGEAVMRCAAKSDGSLGACEAMDESPVDLGFGAAAIGLRSEFRLQPGAGTEGALVPVRVAWTPDLLPPPEEEQRGAPAEIAGDWTGEMTVLLSRVPLGLHLDQRADGSTFDSPLAFIRGAPMGVRRSGAYTLLEVDDQRSRGTIVIEKGPTPDTLTATMVSRLTGISDLATALGEELDPEDVPVFVSSFSLKRGLAPKREVSSRRRAQTPVEPLPYRTEQVVIDAGPHVRLAGTLTLPAKPGPYPAVVLVAGSGATDRDYTSADGHKMFAVLADDLTRRGIAVLRFDKRGVGESTGNLSVAATADLTADARSALAYLTRRPDIDAARVGLIGHSQGAMISTTLAAENPDLAFVVLLGTVAAPGDRTLQEQLRRQLRIQGVAAEAIEARIALQARLHDIIKRGGDDARMTKEIWALLEDPAVVALMAKLSDQRVAVKLAVSAFEKEMVLYDPGPELRRISAPVLAVTGSKDAQTPAGVHLPALRSALATNPDVQIAEAAGLNHMLQTSPTGAPEEYDRTEETISPEALELIGGWVGQHTKPVGAPGDGPVAP